MAKETIFAQQDLTGFEFNNIVNAYVKEIQLSENLVVGETYEVYWDGDIYPCTAYAPMSTRICLANEKFVTGESDVPDEPFLVMYVGELDKTCVVIMQPDNLHTVGIYKVLEPEVYYSVSSASLKAIGDAIRAKGGTSDPLGFPAGMVEAINGITAGGGSSDDVRYVTFMYGSDVLIVKPTAVGDDCADVVTRKLIEKPTKESTSQYEYTHNGWSLTDGGDADNAALVSVTEDRTVYAAFSSKVRVYTVTYYDEDGVTVLKTESLAYGSIPSYTPTKGEAYKFTGWKIGEEVVDHTFVVVEDVALTAVWKKIEYVKIVDRSVSGSKSGTTYYCSINHGKTFELDSGCQYRVTFDSEVYLLTAATMKYYVTETAAYSFVSIGNPKNVTMFAGMTVEKWEVDYELNGTFEAAKDSDVPFVVYLNPSSPTYVCVNYKSSGTHSLIIEKIV